MDIESKNLKNKQKRTSDPERWMIVGYYACCQDQEKTANHFKIHQTTVSRILSKVRNVNDVSDYLKTGRPNTLSNYEEDSITQMLEENRFTTAQEVASELGICKRTALKLLHELGLTFSIPTEIPQLNIGHIQKRYDHAKLFKDRQIDDIIFTDETYFQLFRNTLGVWHLEGSPNVIPKPQAKSCFMVYGAISWYGKSEIYVCQKGFKVNSNSYCDILKQVLIPFAEKTYKKTRKQAQKKDWVLIQDNAPSHRSIYTASFLDSNRITRIQHPPNSPDLNPIELVWAILKNKVEKRCCKNEEELIETIRDEWSAINQEAIQHCISHFKERIEEVYELQGKFV